MFDFEKAFVCVFGNSSMVEMNVSTALFLSGGGIKLLLFLTNDSSVSSVGLYIYIYIYNYSVLLPRLFCFYIYNVVRRMGTQQFLSINREKNRLFSSSFMRTTF